MMGCSGIDYPRRRAYLRRDRYVGSCRRQFRSQPRPRRLRRSVILHFLASRLSDSLAFEFALGWRALLSFAVAVAAILHVIDALLQLAIVPHMTVFSALVAKYVIVLAVVMGTLARLLVLLVLLFWTLQTVFGGVVVHVAIRAAFI